MNLNRNLILWGLAILGGAVLWSVYAAETPAKSSSSPADGPFFAIKRTANVGSNTQQRAFFTAPPPVPHFWRTETDNGSCLQCHAKEFRIEKRHHPIRPVPHAEYTQCMQCHVRGNRDDIEPFVENQFVGLARPGKGQRAHPMAPPTIPHRVFMRDNCNSCHGPTGPSPEYRTTHPNRTQCQQCHVQEKLVSHPFGADLSP